MKSQMNEIRFDRGKIRTLDEGNRKLFCAADVATAIGCADPQEAVKNCCHWDTKRMVLIKDKEVMVTFIPWNDVKALIRNSKQDNKQEIEDELFRLAFTTQKAEKESNNSNQDKDYNKKQYKKQNGLITFDSPQFGKIRTLEINGEPWFVGKDVAISLGYSNTTRAIRVHVDSDDKGKTKMVSPGGEQQSTIINESGLYSLILSSKLPTAKAFKRWITHDVIPAIRKTGGYMTDALAQKVQADPDELQRFVRAFIKEKDRADKLEQELAEAQPKIDGYNQFLNNDGCTTIRVTAKELDVPEKQFTKLLVDKKVLFRTRDGYLLPYANKKNSGMFVVRDFISASGELLHQTLFTTKGKLYVNRIIRENAGAWR